jgi:RNA polymerase sigma-70 factor (ECF subfamily)
MTRTAAVAIARRDLAGASDAELVHLVLRGHRDAYAPLVNRHLMLLYRHARGLGLDHDTSLDLVQDAFVKAFARLEECHDPARFRAWAFRIARNLCLDHMKNVRRLSVPMSHVEGVDELPAERGDTDGDVDGLLCDALHRLPVALREAFLLKHDAGYTYDEIADLTNASPSAVKMRVHRAREALRSFLIGQGVTGA